MKAKTREMLLVLSAKHSKASLVALWQDLRILPRADFERVLDELANKPPRARREPRARDGQRARPSQPRNDQPVTRIAHQLRERLSLTDDEAIAKLSRALLS